MAECPSPCLQRSIDAICSVVANHHYKMELFIDDSSYLFIVSDVETQAVYGQKLIAFKHKKKFSYHLGLYFGGNRPAPHPMTVEMKKL